MLRYWIVSQPTISTCDLIMCGEQNGLYIKVHLSNRQLLSLCQLIRISRNFLNFSCTKNIQSLLVQMLKICWSKCSKLCQRVLTNKRHTWLKPWRKNLSLKWLVLIRENFKGTWPTPLFMEFFCWSKDFKQ